MRGQTTDTAHRALFDLLKDAGMSVHDAVPGGKTLQKINRGTPGP